MNHIINDYGQEVPAVGYEGSLARIKAQYPKLISRLNSLYSQRARIDEAIEEIRANNIRDSIITSALLESSYYGQNARPGSVTSIVIGLGKPRIVPTKIEEHLKSNWCSWRCNVALPGGKWVDGYVEADESGELIAEESLQILETEETHVDH